MTLAAPWVLHVDLDQFIAAVEVLRRPELAGLPVVVGGRGDPTERGVVATASYEARASGVGSGMPLRVAARKCPEAVFLPVDKEAYDAASVEVMQTLRALTWGGVPVVVEVLGWDEAFLAAGAEHGDLGDPREFAGHVRSEVLAATGLHCSVGIGDNKLRAKIATDFGKPRGVWQLTAENWDEVMGERPTTALWGIGSRTGKKLARDRHRRPAGCVRRAGARRRARADDGAVVPPARPRRRHQPGGRHALGGAGPRSRGDVPD